MNDEEMLAAIRHRDGSGMERVMTAYSRLLWKVAAEVLCPLGSEADAEDCIADVYIDLWEHPDSFDPGRGTLKSWLCMRTRCRAIDRYRMRMRSRTIPIDSIVSAESFGVQEQVLREETYRELKEAVVSLEEEERDILLRRYVAGQKPKAIAAALGLSVKQVDNSLYRTKQKLRHRLTQLKGE